MDLANSAASPTNATVPSATAVADPNGIVQGERYRVTVLTDGLLRLEYSPDGAFEDRPSSLARHRRQPVPEFRVNKRGPVIELTTQRLRLTYDGGPFTPAGLKVEVFGGLTAFNSVWRYGEPAYGLGGTRRTLDGADGALPLGPGVISRDGVAVLDDSRSLVFEPDGWVQPRDGTRHDLYVFGYGHDYLSALRAFYALSGPVPVLPRWALGNWWSRYYRYSADSYRELMRKFRREAVPFSVAVLDMDWHVTDVDPALGSGWTGYTWNRDLIPDPGGLLSWLHSHGLRVTLNVHPADGIRSHEEAYPAMCATLGRVPDGSPVAFDPTDREFLNAYFEVLHRGLEADGVDFWWIDWQSGTHSDVTGIDPLWLLNQFHYQDNARHQERALILSRYAGPGSHRYPAGFSGDTVISWDSLAFQPFFMASASNIGFGWWSNDIGGHFHGVKDDELATRWVQLGCFSPILRLHSSDNQFTDKAPWAFRPEAREVQKRFLRLRHRLVPYLHTMNHRAARHATPLVLPLYYSWPESKQAYRIEHQFLFGSQLMVAAITSPADPSTGLASVRVWLPAGTWVDLFTGQIYDGERMMDLHRGLDSLPVLAQPGAIIPLDGESVPPNDPVNPVSLDVIVVPGADGAFELIEDCGSGDLSDPDSVATTPIRYLQTGSCADQDIYCGSRIVIGPASGDMECLPAFRSWTVSLAAADIPADALAWARINGRAAAVNSERAGHALRLTVQEVPATARLEIGPGCMAGLTPGLAETRLFSILDRAQIEYDLKSEAYQVATSDLPLHVRLAHLRVLDLPGRLASALDEILLAR